MSDHQATTTETREPTTSRLATALTLAHAPQSMVEAALAGVYDDFKSASATPIMNLYHACLRNGLRELAGRVRDGEFDAQDWEVPG